jgi:hypothetical protein
MREFDFFSKIEYPRNCRFLQPLKSNSFLLLFYSEKNVLNLLCLDKNGNTLFDKKDFIKNKKIEEFIDLHFAYSKKNKAVFIFTEEKHLNQTNKFFYLRSFDENFNLMAEIKLDEEPIDYEVNGDNLFLLNINGKCCKILMCNHNLEIVQTFGQKNPLHPFYFSPNADLFLVSNQYFIINETRKTKGDIHNSVTILNRSNGLVEASFVILEDFHKMKLYLDKFLLTFNNETCSLKCYNFKGDLLHKITLDKKFEGSDINVTKKKLCFVFGNDIISIF